MNTQQDPVSGALASHGSLIPRLGARLIDFILLGLVGSGLGSLGLGFGYGWLILVAASVLAYFVVLDVSVGATVGKRLLRLRVDGPEGGRPSVSQAVLRELFTLLGAIPFAGPPLTLMVWIAIGISTHTSPTKQGMHDRIAGGTQVTST